MAQAAPVLHQEDNGDKMQNTCEIDEEVPDHMEIFLLWFGIKEGTDRIHNSTSDDQS